MPKGVLTYLPRLILLLLALLVAGFYSPLGAAPTYAEAAAPVSAIQPVDHNAVISTPIPSFENWLAQLAAALPREPRRMVTSALLQQGAHLSVEAAITPNRLVVGQAAMVTVEIRNSGTVSLSDLEFKNVLPAALDYIESDPSIDEPVQNQLIQEVAHDELAAALGSLASDETLTLSYLVKVDEITEAAVVIADVVEVNANELETPALAEFTVVVADPDQGIEVIHDTGITVIEDKHITLHIPQGATGDDGQAIRIQPASESTTASNENLLVAFDLMLLGVPDSSHKNLSEAAQDEAIQSCLVISDLLDYQRHT
jgi:uncharacterized repeat protein (TIGR01451 family)